MNNYVKTLVSVFSLSLLTACSGLKNSTLIKEPTATKPNIIVLYTDDISAREFAIYNSTKWSGYKGNTVNDQSKLAKTPVIDQIAQQGIYATTAWAATVCSPSRAMMMTGRYAQLHKWWHNKDYGSITDENGRKRPVRLYETSPLQIGHITQQSGYGNIWVGKTQMGHNDNFDRYGFDEGVFTPNIEYPKPTPYTDFAVLSRQENNQRVLYNNDSKEIIEHRSYVQQGWYWQPNVQLMNYPNTTSFLTYWPHTPEAQANFGVNTFGPDVELDFIFEFMDRQKQNDKPFFIYHTTHLGHDAFDFLNPKSTDKWPGTPKVSWDGEKYTRIQPNITGDKGNYELNGTVSESGIHRHIEYLDYQVWLYLNKLKAMGEENNTVFIITSDNGTSGYGKHSHIRQQGTHVPFIVYAPGMEFTKQGKQDILVSIADVYATLLDITGFKLPGDYPIDGKSLWPYLTTNKTHHRDWIYAYKKDKTLIRGFYVMKDGNGDWWDVQNTPDDLDSYQQITDWSAVSERHRQEQKALLKVLPKYDVYHQQHDANN
ncbi:MAG: sulfatase-like hydrolase/transferase [Gammaproteobacteria bacterium]|nr:sulfatase-like hydrolase/transferase [Gammaproteobacteria bacterium]